MKTGMNYTAKPFIRPCIPMYWEYKSTKTAA